MRTDKQMSTKSNYPEGRLKRENSHHRPRKDSSKGSTMSASPVSTAFSDSSPGSSAGVPNFTLHTSSDVKNDGVLRLKTTPVVVSSPTMPQDLVHSDQEYAFDTFRFVVWTGNYG